MKSKEPEGLKTYTINLLEEALPPDFELNALQLLLHKISCALLCYRKNNVLQESEKVKVKLSGDGACMSRLSNFILLSLSILQRTEDMLSLKGNYMKHKY